MAEKLLTTRRDLDDAFIHLLSLARKRIRIFDGSLASFPLTQKLAMDGLQAFLDQDPEARLSIALQDPEPCRSHNPRLMTLLRQRSHAFALLQVPEALAGLQDAMLLVDDRHALVRFHRDQSRGKLIEDDALACRPYNKRYEDILESGCSPISGTSLGL